jgi:hypothetical protein
MSNNLKIFIYFKVLLVVKEEFEDTKGAIRIRLQVLTFTAVVNCLKEHFVLHFCLT